MKLHFAKNILTSKENMTLLKSSHQSKNNETLSPEFELWLSKTMPWIMLGEWTVEDDKIIAEHLEKNGRLPKLKRGLAITARSLKKKGK